MKVKYKDKINDKKDKLAYLYRLQQLVIDEFNEKGKDFREKKISNKDFNSYKIKIFEKRIEAINDEIVGLQEKMKKDSLQDVSIKEGFE